MAGNGRITLSAETEIKLALALFFLVLLAADLFSIYSLVRTRRQLDETQNRVLVAVLENLSNDLSRQGSSQPAPGLEMKNRLRALGLEGSAGFYAADGSLLSQTTTYRDSGSPAPLPPRIVANSIADSEHASVQTAEFDGKRFLTVTKAFRTADGRLAGYVSLAEPLHAGRWISDRFITAFQIAVLFLCLPFIVYLSRWLTRPYREIAQVAAEHDIQLPADGDAPRRRSLADAFREIVQQLRMKERELERVNLIERRRAQSFETLSGRIVESIPSGLIGFDREGRTIISNDQAHRIFQVRSLGPDSAESISCESFFKSSPELTDMVKETLSTGRTFRYRELEANLGAGSRRTLGVSLSPIGRGYKDIQGALCLVSDVTELNDLKERVRVRENLANLGEMAAGIAHEFKNSLATIHGFAQLLQSRSYDAQTSEEIAGSVIDETQHLTQMVTEFLNFAGPQRIAFSDVEMAELIAECKEELAAVTNGSRISLSAEGPLPRVPGDATLLRHAILNLLRNAVEAIPEESARREVRLCTRIVTENEGGQALELEISDTGCGIEPSILSKIFVPFFTTKSKGHGIGLALVQKIFSGHNGSIRVESAPGQGSTFRCRLPLSSKSPAVAGEEQTNPPAGAEQGVL